MNSIASATAPRVSAPLYKICVRGENPDHHLWNNHGTWFVHYTVHPTSRTKERVRRSLQTKDIFEARERRDRFFEALLGSSRSPQLECAIS
jgi:hypothetical protein